MNERSFIGAGWWGYFICAAIYVVSGLRAGDWLSLLGSFFFLVATVSFMIPHYFMRNSEEERSDD